MKVNTDSFPIKGLDKDEQAQKKHPQADKKSDSKDRVTLSKDTLNRVIKENQAAAKTELLDFKRAEEEISSLTEKILGDKLSAADLHQLDVKRIRFLFS